MSAGDDTSLAQSPETSDCSQTITTVLAAYPLT